jgi:uncharacterized protein YkwD
MLGTLDVTSGRITTVAVVPLKRLLAALALALLAALATAAGAAASTGSHRKAVPGPKRQRATRHIHWRHTRSRRSRHLAQRHRAARHHRHHRHHRSVAHLGACPGAELRPTAHDLARVRAATLCLVNRQRVMRGERPLALNARLQRTAQGHTRDMAYRDYFDHSRGRGDTLLSRMRAARYIFSSRIGYEIGENIGWGTLWLATPRAMVAAWMASPGHRANILDPRFHDTAVGVSAHPPSSLARGQAGAIYTQDFGGLLGAGRPRRAHGSPEHARCAAYGQCFRIRPVVRRRCPRGMSSHHRGRRSSLRRVGAHAGARRRCVGCRGCRAARRARSRRARAPARR